MGTGSGKGQDQDKGKGKVKSKSKDKTVRVMVGVRVRVSKDKGKGKGRQGYKDPAKKTLLVPSFLLSQTRPSTSASEQMWVHVMERIFLTRLVRG